MLLAEKIVLSTLALALVMGAGGLYWLITKPVPPPDPLMFPEIATPLAEEWREYYPKTIPINIAGIDMLASVANTVPDRIKGLSGTSYLPDGLVKLFAFHVAGKHSIWMKDMNYPLDIMWLEEDGTIVHIAEKVSPDSYPTSFAPPVPAWYVIEANAGFVASSSITVGDKVVL